MTKEKLIHLGWTPEKLRERMHGCFLGIKEAKQRGGPELWTYRLFFIRLYLGYKRDLKIILS